MKTSVFRTALLIAGLAAALALPAGPAAAACLSSGEASAAIASGEAMRLGQIARRVGGDIVNAELCEAGGRLVYRLAVMTADGRIETVVVDARTGEILGR